MFADDSCLLPPCILPNPPQHEPRTCTGRQPRPLCLCRCHVSAQAQPLQLHTCTHPPPPHCSHHQGPLPYVHPQLCTPAAGAPTAAGEPGFGSVSSHWLVLLGSPADRPPNGLRHPSSRMTCHSGASVAIRAPAGGHPESQECRSAAQPRPPPVHQQWAVALAAGPAFVLSTRNKQAARYFSSKDGCTWEQQRTAFPWLSPYWGKKKRFALPS